MNGIAVHRYLEYAATQPQRLGSCDCVTFVRDVLLAGWGRDIGRHLQYTDRRSAVARLRQTGGLEEAFTAVLGELQPICELAPGDVIYFPNRGQRTVGVLLPQFVVARGHRVVHRVIPPDNAMGWPTDGC